MTAFENIIKAIEEFGYPHCPDTYTGVSNRYFTYNYADDRGALFADNTPQTTIASVQVHLVIPSEEDFTGIKDEVRKSLFRQGFTFPQITVLKEEKKRHIIFECDIEESEE